MIFNYLCSTASTGASGTNTSSPQSPVTMILLMVGLFAIMYLLMIRPQKKKQAEEQKLRDSVQIGDEITTIGGIVGKIVSIKDDMVTFETGEDRVRLQIMRWAISTTGIDKQG